MKTSEKSLVISIDFIPCAKWKVHSRLVGRVSFKSNWIDIWTSQLSAFLSPVTHFNEELILKMLKMPPTPWLVWLPPPSIQEDPKLGTGQHDGEQQIISYLSWKRVLVRVWVTTFCLSVAMSFIWCCEDWVQISTFLRWALDKVIWCLENAAFCQTSKRVVYSLSRWFYLYWSWWWCEFKENICVCETESPGGLTLGLELASLTSLAQQFEQNGPNFAPTTMWGEVRWTSL